MKSQQELKQVLKDYKIHWNIWTTSPACFLEPLELALIDECFSKKSDKECADCLGLTELNFIEILMKLVHKLKIKVVLFEKWKEELYTESFFESEEKGFLNTDYNFLPISKELKQWLFYTHLPTLQKLIENYSELDLIVLYDFPQHLIFELKTYIGFRQSFWFGSQKMPKKKLNIIKNPKLFKMRGFQKVNLN